MPLEMGNFPVKEMLFGQQTRWQDGILEVNRDEMLELVKQDPHINSVLVDIVSPGESVRVINYTDILEPRVKVEGPGVAYPGICGRPTKRVGQGRTHRLANCTVVECIDASALPLEQRPWNTSRHTGSPDPFFDMSGPNAVTPAASSYNLCLVVEAPRDMPAEDRYLIIHSAIMRVADRLAQTVAELEPPEIETFDLTPKTDLPGAVFIPLLASGESTNGSRSSMGIAVYGQTRLSAPWMLDGTEMLDGAVSQGQNQQTNSWILANNPTVLEMCRRHGVKFNFLGCVVQRSNWTMQSEKEMAAEQTAHLARAVGAEGAIITTSFRGARWVETTLTVQACEQAGLKTVLLTEEEDPENGTAPPFLITIPEMVAVVSSGTGEVPNVFPPVQKVVGTVSRADERWYGELPPIPGRYGAQHAQDAFGYSRKSLVDF